MIERVHCGAVPRQYKDIVKVKQCNLSQDRLCIEFVTDKATSQGSLHSSQPTSSLLASSHIPCWPISGLRVPNLWGPGPQPRQCLQASSTLAATLPIPVSGVQVDTSSVPEWFFPAKASPGPASGVLTRGPVNIFPWFSFNGLADSCSSFAVGGLIDDIQPDLWLCNAAVWGVRVAPSSSSPYVPKVWRAWECFLDQFYLPPGYIPFWQKQNVMILLNMKKAEWIHWPILRISILYGFR